MRARWHNDAHGLYTQSYQSSGGPAQTNKHPPNYCTFGGSEWVAEGGGGGGG